MPTDLQRIELAFPAEAMLHVVDHGADLKDPAVQRVRRLLIGTVDEGFAGFERWADPTSVGQHQPLAG